MEDKYVTIKMSNHAPVRVNPDFWPIVAEAEHCEVEREWRLGVRRHASCGAIVFGEYETGSKSEHGLAGGEVVPMGGDISAAIHRLAKYLGCNPRLADECIRKLPERSNGDP